ncbi:nucleotide-binding universal stress UspA family protein [Ulvibacter sp. MAR_2010_11]|uniref:universal stress protein n=1 Tax=Ulvibacter sp. MAR_2010_11 TaxID=1250229 RepID=UPI000C2C259B|nr:universal stress protein [Ulvibacter sp. MAR_2010_11]PKA84492.1 nucleotide-binding universal stress UspA family protein [Ulvibacter sp. MAR_2010_11]
MRKIIIPTDFSESAMTAIRYAMELFKYEKSEMIIMNAFADDVYENTMEMDREFFEEYKQKTKEATERALQKIVAEMLAISFNPKHTYNYVASFGSLVDEVNDLVDKHNADVVVMGTKGKSNREQVTFGSQTLQVIKYVKCPVLAVPVGYKGYPLKNILFPTDYMLPVGRRELKLVSTLAARFVSRIQFLHISDVSNLSHRQMDNKIFLSKCFEDNQVSHKKSAGNDITQIINKTIKEASTDMLVMVNHRHSYLENIFYQSTIEKIGLEINIPFLVLQNLQRN